MREASASLKSSVATHLYVSEIIVRNATIELGSLNAIGIIGFQVTGPK